MKIRNSFFALAFLALASRAAADQANLGASQQEAVWLRLPSNARAAGMGNAFGAMGEDVGCAAFNPAGLSQLQGPELFVMHDAWFQDVAMERVLGGLTMGPGQSVGLSLDYLSLGSLNSYSVGSGGQVVPGGTVSPASFDLSAIFAQELLGPLSAGVAVRFIQQNWTAGSSSDTWACDLGLLTKDVLPRLNAGLALLNLGGAMDGGSLPTVLKGALAYKTAVFQGGHSFNLAADLDVPVAQDRAMALNFGVEYWYKNLLALRAGEQVSDDRAGSATDPTANNGLTLGIGLDLGYVRLDYAFLTNGLLGNSNLVSLLARL